MRPLLSEFLGLLDTRGACWGQVEMSHEWGLRVRPKGAVMFYAQLEGSSVLSGVGSQAVMLNPRDVAIVVSDAVQALRSSLNAAIKSADFLDNDEYRDALHRVSLGVNTSGVVLCGRLKVRWPAGIGPQHMPAFVRICAEDSIIDFDVLLRKAIGPGAAALVTRAAATLLTEGLRDHPNFQDIFRDANFRDPISRAVQYMNLHAKVPWTVSMLADKVGMARSTFAGRFHKEVGTTPLEYLTDIRMRKAADLLEQSEIKLSEIAESVSYKSQSAFSHRFEAHFKTTPGRMRSLARQKRKRRPAVDPDTASSTRLER